MFYQLKMLYKCEILYYSSPKNICIILGGLKGQYLTGFDLQN